MSILRIHSAAEQVADGAWTGKCREGDWGARATTPTMPMKGMAELLAMILKSAMSSSGSVAGSQQSFFVPNGDNGDREG